MSVQEVARIASPVIFVVFLASLGCFALGWRLGIVGRGEDSI